MKILDLQHSHDGSEGTDSSFPPTTTCLLRHEHSHTLRNCKTNFHKVTTEFNLDKLGERKMALSLFLFFFVLNPFFLSFGPVSVRLVDQLLL